VNPLPDGFPALPAWNDHMFPVRLLITEVSLTSLPSVLITA
jgi:hypothetical protein